MYGAGAVFRAVYPQQKHVGLCNVAVVQTERLVRYRNGRRLWGRLIFRRIYRHLARTNGHLKQRQNLLDQSSLISRKKVSISENV